MRRGLLEINMENNLESQQPPNQPKEETNLTNKNPEQEQIHKINKRAKASLILGCMVIIVNVIFTIFLPIILSSTVLNKNLYNDGGITTLHPKEKEVGDMEGYAAIATSIGNGFLGLAYLSIVATIYSIVSFGAPGTILVVSIIFLSSAKSAVKKYNLSLDSQVWTKFYIGIVFSAISMIFPYIMALITQLTI